MKILLSPLTRRRVRGQLNELRTTYLRFTPADAAEFLNRVMGHNLSAKDIAALENRTEGWIAGLQLAARIFQEWNDMEAAEQHTQQSLQLWEYVGLKR